jgi:GntR family transcriptional repressor for pyruvate dehydrogenase complex
MRSESRQPVASEAAWRPVSRAPTYQLVVERIEEQILAGALRVGDRLPPERELAGLLGVSRPAVREGLRMLEAQGVLSAAVGTGPESGTIISAVPDEALTRLLRLHVALSSFPHDDVVEARVMLERWSARLAARNATEADRAQMRRMLDLMDDPELPRHEFNELDTAFHVALAEASSNRLVADMTKAIRGAVRPAILAAFEDLPDWPALAAELRVQHRAVLDAVEARDPDAAAAAVERHVRGFFGALQGGS